MKKRNIGLDLLKIIGMFMILFIHFMMREKNQANYNPSSLNIILLWFINSFCFIAVNCYFLVTAYFSIDKRTSISKILKIWGITLFYTLSFLIIFLIVKREEVTSTKIIKSIFPVITENYWFVTVYIAIAFLSPILNIFLKALTKKQYQYLLILLFVILSVIGNIYPYTIVFNNLSGSNFITMLFIYIIGGYIKLHINDENIKKEKYLLVHIICSILIFIYTIITEILSHKKGGIFRYYALKNVSYNSVFMIISSVCLFLYFKNIKIENKISQKIITTLQPLTFAVYLIHENVFIKNFTFNALKYQNTMLYVPYLLLGITIIFFACCIIEMVRKQLFKLIGKTNLAKNINNKITKIDTKFENIFCNENVKIEKEDDELISANIK